MTTASQAALFDALARRRALKIISGLQNFDLQSVLKVTRAAQEGEEGYGCINGINIFKYDLPWRVFGLDPDRATDEDIKAAFYRLSKIYHPDSPTGDDKIFQRLTLFYKSLTEKFEQWL